LLCKRVLWTAFYYCLVESVAPTVYACAYFGVMISRLHKLPWLLARMCDSILWFLGHSTIGQQVPGSSPTHFTADYVPEQAAHTHLPLTPSTVVLVTLCVCVWEHVWAVLVPLVFSSLATLCLPSTMPISVSRWYWVLCRFLPLMMQNAAEDNWRQVHRASTWWASLSRIDGWRPCHVGQSEEVVFFFRHQSFFARHHREGDVADCCLSVHL